MDPCTTTVPSMDSKELYFLITKFLSAGPCREAAEVLRREIGEHGLLPKRLDWEGEEHEQSFEEFEVKCPHIAPSYLAEVCSRIGPLLDKELPPSVPNVSSLLGAGRQSLLRTIKNAVRQWYSIREYTARLHQQPLLDAPKFQSQHNIVKALVGREQSGPLTRTLTAGPKLFSKMQLHRRTLGHLSAVYCVLFDRTGRYTITGADDLLVKVWSTYDGRLLSTLRGASSEITDIAVNNENTLLAAGSLDRILRVWCMQYCSPVAVLTGHTGMITSVNFCPAIIGDYRYLVTTSTDGSVAFWYYSHQSSTQQGKQVKFLTKPLQYNERMRPGQAQMICASFSAGGMFLAAGSADHHVRVYLMEGDEGPHRILETEAHTDRVDSICWAHNELRFISGSKDGTANIWYYERQQWKSIKLHMKQKLPGEKESEEDSKIKLKVMMVCWDLSDRWVITAVSDHMLKVWNSDTGALMQVLRGHEDEVFVLEAHPCDPHILLSAGHDGMMFVWDILSGTTLTKFQNTIEGQGHGAIFDAKWSPDGTVVAATDSHGHILTFGLGSGCARHTDLPKELFFHTDYRPLIRDANHYVLDEQTQMAPHLMPPPFLVDIDGNPYPPSQQRLVPGRENCHLDQLVPNITVSVGGHQEVIAGVEPHEPRSHIDEMIAVLAQRQPTGHSNGNEAGSSGHVPGTPGGSSGGGVAAPGSAGSGSSSNRNASSPRQGGQHLVGMRRTGDVEGVRQSSGNWQRDNDVRWTKRVLIKPAPKHLLRANRHKFAIMSAQEMEQYKKEQRRRPVMITTSAPSGRAPNRKLVRPNTRRNGVVRGISSLRRSQRPHAGQNDDSDFENPDDLDLGSQSSGEDEPRRNGILGQRGNGQDEDDDLMNFDELQDSSASPASSSEYSDWIADQGANLEPPKRAKRKPVRASARARRAAASVDESHSEETDDSDEPVLEPDSEEEKKKPKPKPKPKKKPPPPIVHPPIPPGGELPEPYRPSEWLAQVVPKKSPYYPQMGDEVMFFKEGYQLYLDNVRNKKVYDPGPRCEPYEKLNLEEPQLVKVVYIKYEIRPPRLCCLKLGILSPSGAMGQIFSIKYHDMNDVLDFFVLRQTYVQALQRNWEEGDRFRSMIKDDWWTGVIESKTSKESPFLSLRVKWDTEEMEYMSPWDLEPLDPERLPEETGGSVPVLPEEINSMLYQPCEEEWPQGGREIATQRILEGLEQVMDHSVAENFLAPVDLQIYPSYAFSIEYPIDLSLIKARFENHFYRRITAAQFDVRYLATNAEKFNEPHSSIVKAARIVSELCLKIISSPVEVDVLEECHQMLNGYHSSPSGSEEVEVDADVDDADKPGPSGLNGLAQSTRSRKPKGTARQRVLMIDPEDWRRQCIDLLELLWHREDALPFREPVDLEEHPDYLQIVKTPKDLSSIRGSLLDGDYETPMAFARDFRLIFSNSKTYNTDSRSRIYAMTIRLSALFEEHMKEIVHSWKALRVRTQASLLTGRPRHPVVPSDSDDSDDDSCNRASQSNSQPDSRPSTSSRTDNQIRRTTAASRARVTRQQISSDDGDDDDDDDDKHAAGPSSRVPKANGFTNGHIRPSQPEETKSESSDEENSGSQTVRVSTRATSSKRKRLYESDNSYDPSPQDLKKRRATQRRSCVVNSRLVERNNDSNNSDDTMESQLLNKRSNSVGSEDSGNNIRAKKGKTKALLTSRPQRKQNGTGGRHKDDEDDDDEEDEEDEEEKKVEVKKVKVGKKVKSKCRKPTSDSETASESTSESSSDDNENAHEDDEDSADSDDDSEESVDLHAPPSKTSRATRSKSKHTTRTRTANGRVSVRKDDSDEDDSDEDDSDEDDSEEVDSDEQLEGEGSDEEQEVKKKVKVKKTGTYSKSVPYAIRPSGNRRHPIKKPYGMKLKTSKSRPAGMGNTSDSETDLSDSQNGEVEDEEEDEDEDEAPQGIRARAGRSARKNYNENNVSDSEESVPPRIQKSLQGKNKRPVRGAAQNQPSVIDSETSDEEPSRIKNSRKRQATKTNYVEEDSEEEVITTVSSRGRVRKVTEKARALYKH